MATSFELNAESRNDMGKGASRRLRRTGKVPAIIYGGDTAPQNLSIGHNELLRRLEDEAFYSHILTINIDGKSEQAVLRDLQRHPAKPVVLHVDLQRVKAGQALRMHVPLHFKGEQECPGVKTQGGIVNHNRVEVEVECMPKDLPEFIEVDASQLSIGESVHLSQVTLPNGVVLVELHNFEHLDEDERHEIDQPVISIAHPRVEKVVDETAEAEAPVAAADAKPKAEGE